VATAAAFAAWFAGLRHLNAATVGLVGLLNPVAAVILGTLVAGEPFGPRQIAGITIVLTGVLIGQRPGAWHRTRNAPHAADLPDDAEPVRQHVVPDDLAVTERDPADAAAGEPP